MTPMPDLCCAPGAVSDSQPIPGYSPAAVLNLDGLHNRCMGNIDLVQRVLRTFQQRLPEELDELEEVLERGDATQIARVAHRIHGNSANVSAEGIQRVAAEIEDLSHTGRVSDIPLRIERLRGEWERYLDYASTLFSAADAG
jgi:HPt (histidine-containing phosphotransfer) domain-containing protein